MHVAYPVSPEDAVAIEEEYKKAERSKKGNEMDYSVPFCHGEPMIRCYTYEAADGSKYGVFRCGHCNMKEEVIVQDTYEECVRWQ
jgi:hypothetical protein